MDYEHYEHKMCPFRPPQQEKHTSPSCGGLNIGGGAPELVTGSRDGTVRVWDPRQKDAVLSLEPVDGEIPADCWTVRIAESFRVDHLIPIQLSMQLSQCTTIAVHRQ